MNNGNVRYQPPAARFDLSGMTLLTGFVASVLLVVSKLQG
jgi:hypothetical protein